MKIPARGFQPSQERAVIDESLRDEMHDFTLPFQHPVYAQQAGAQQFAPLFFDQAVPYHDIDVAGFVFERDEHDARSRARTLTAGHDASRTREPSMRKLVQFRRGGKPQTSQPAAQQSERMTAQG